MGRACRVCAFPLLRPLFRLAGEAAAMASDLRLRWEGSVVGCIVGGRFWIEGARPVGPAAKAAP
eukprot:3214553-Lingulodinium_polyedra.AAC.1